MATHSSILAWEIPGTEKPGRLVHGVAESNMTVAFSKLNTIILNHCIFTVAFSKVHTIILNHYIFNSSFKLPRTGYTFQKTCTLPILLWVQKASVGSPVFLKLGHCQNCHTTQSIITMLGLTLTQYSLKILDQAGQKTKQKNKKSFSVLQLLLANCGRRVHCHGSNANNITLA